MIRRRLFSCFYGIMTETDITQLFIAAWCPHHGDDFLFLGDRLARLVAPATMRAGRCTTGASASSR